MPLVSVVIPTYNSAKYLRETVSSIQKQEFSDYEIIIVDDKSTDNTREVVESCMGGNVRYFCLDTNHGGPSRARNVGIRKARGRYVALCDSDDLWTSGHLKAAVDFLAREHVSMTFTDSRRFDDVSGRDLGRFLNGYNRFLNIPKRQVSDICFVVASDDAFSCLFCENYILPSGVVLSRDIFDDIGMFDESLTNGDDRDMWFRITREHNIGFISHAGFNYRVRSTSISNRGKVLAFNRIKVLKKQIESGLPVDLQKNALELISENYYNIGFSYQKEGEMRHALSFYVQSLRASRRNTYAAAKGILVALLGRNIYFFLQKQKKSVK